MKVKYKGELYPAKYFKDLTPEEVADSTGIPEMWEDDALFMDYPYSPDRLRHPLCWTWVYPVVYEGYELIKEDGE